MENRSDATPWWLSIWLSVVLAAVGAAVAQIAPYKWLGFEELPARLWGGILTASIFFGIGFVFTWLVRRWRRKRGIGVNCGDTRRDELHSRTSLLHALESTLNLFASAVEKLYNDVEGEKDPSKKNQAVHFKSATRKARLDYLQLNVELLRDSLIRAGWSERIDSRRALQSELEEIAGILKPRVLRDPEAAIAKASRRAKKLLAHIKKETGNTKALGAET